ncbi:MAG: ankyrin repeat domain-containing protein [Methylobacter sp.]
MIGVAFRGYDETARWLLEHGAKPDLANHQGNTAEKLA